MILKLSEIAGFNTELTTTAPADRYDHSLVSLYDVEDGEELKDGELLIKNSWVIVFVDGSGHRNYLHSGPAVKADIQFTTDLSGVLEKPIRLASADLGEILGNANFECAVDNLDVQKFIEEAQGTDHPVKYSVVTHLLNETNSDVSLSAITVISIRLDWDTVKESVESSLKELGVEEFGVIVYDAMSMIRTLGGLTLGQPLITQPIEGIENINTCNLIIYDAGTAMSKLLEPLRYHHLENLVDTSRWHVDKMLDASALNQKPTGEGEETK